MTVRLIVSLIAGAGVVIGAAQAQAGPCTKKIARFEQAVRASADKPGAGPMAPQTIAAQDDRQPTPASMKRADERAQAGFAAALARAKRLDAHGRRRQCMRALAAAERLYDLQ